MVELILILVVALLGGLAARAVRAPVLVGYIFAGVALGLLGFRPPGIEKIAEIGVVLLLFSLGLEFSLERLTKIGSRIIVAAILQVVLVSLLGFAFLGFLGFDSRTSMILAAGFSLSSTALVIKLLGDKGELTSVYGQVMSVWLLTQDLLVIFLLAAMPMLAGHTPSVILLARSLVTTVTLSGVVFLLGSLISPFVVHRIALSNSRELMLLSGFIIALGTAYLASSMGLSAAIGAFLAGVAISETQENHAIFAETRPLRDLFAVVFFVSLGLVANAPLSLATILPLLAVLVFVISVKILVVVILMGILGYRGRTLIISSFGLSGVGEFAFILFLLSKNLQIISEASASVGILVSLLSLVLTPFLLERSVLVWRLLRKFSLFSQGLVAGPASEFFDHVIICGYGRIGRWVGKALEAAKIPFVVVDYNHKTAREVRASGIPVIYGDPSEKEVIEAAGVSRAKAVVVAIPDRVAEEELISYVQTNTPNVRIIGRAHLDSDVAKLKLLRIDKVVQPEFEGAASIVRDLFRMMGKGKEEISQRLRSLRLSYATKV